MGLEKRLKQIGGEISETTHRCFECGINWYNQTYDRFPRTTKFLSALVGTTGGDYIAKRFIQGEELQLRDIAFTSFAAVYQSFFYPKLIDYTEKISEIKSVKKTFQKIGISKEWSKALIIGGLFFIPNMLYWGLLSVKNQSKITFKTTSQAAKSIAIGSVPYLGVDYMVANKLKKKYCLPMWSAAEIVYNTFIAGVAYFTR